MPPFFPSDPPTIHLFLLTFTLSRFVFVFSHYSFPLSLMFSFLHFVLPPFHFIFLASFLPSFLPFPSFLFLPYLLAYLLSYSFTYLLTLLLSFFFSLFLCFLLSLLCILLTAKVMMKSLDINFGIKLRVQEDGGAVEIEMEPSKKVIISFITLR